MQGTYVIEVAPQKHIPDSAGTGLEHDCHAAGLKGVGKVRVSQLYRLIGNLSASEQERIARDLLTDPVIQESRDGALSPKNGLSIDVWFKPGVTDVVGESVLKGIQDLGIKGISSVRTGSRYQLLKTKRADLGKKVALSFLVNPLVQDYVLHVD
jgi:phosphoribosylformylglycinamidine (FGAM) synthase PurS component